MTYHQARPFWVEEDIEAYGCCTSFGNPSGHSATAMGFFLILYLDYVNSVKSGHFAHPVCKVTFGILTICFAIAIGYSRLFLGQHTLNQVVYGWSIGIWAAFTFHYCLSELMMNNV